MNLGISLVEWILGLVLIITSIGVILSKKPVIACLFFLLTLLTLAVVYLQLSAQFIAVMQVIVYAGAILVIFMFVIILFQDAYQQISRNQANSSPLFLFIAGAAFLITLISLGRKLMALPPSKAVLHPDFGIVQSIGKLIYIDFFFPFEAIIFLFLIAVIGALYIGKRVVK